MLAEEKKDDDSMKKHKHVSIRLYVLVPAAFVVISLILGGTVVLMSISTILMPFEYALRVANVPVEASE